MLHFSGRVHGAVVEGWCGSVDDDDVDIAFSGKEEVELDVEVDISAG